MNDSALSSLLSITPAILIIGFLVWRFHKAAKTAAAAHPRPEGVTPYGVGGWLALFVFGSCVLAPLQGFGRLSTTLMEAEQRTPQLAGLDSWNEYKVVSWLALLAFVVWQWWVAYGLWNRFAPRSAFHAKLLLGLLPFVSVGTDAIAAKTLLEVAPGENTVAAFAKVALVGGVWFLYFVRSRRVKNTYYHSSTPAVASSSGSSA